MQIYFNPNWDPSYFYPLIKPLAVIYDQILIWSPVASQLEAASFVLDDFLAACQPTTGEPPAIIAAGRDSWFDSTSRRLHPDPECRHFDSAFENKVQQAAEAGGTVLPVTDLDTGYRVMDDIWDSAEDRTHIERIAKVVSTDFPESMMVRIKNVSQRNSRPLSWAIANAFVQDVVAINHLGAVAPLVSMEHAQGYLCLAPRAYEGAAGAKDIKDLHKRIASGQEMPDLPQGIRAQDIRRFLEDAYAASGMTWAEVAKLRKSHGKKIRKWLNEALQARRRPLSASTLSDVALFRARSLHKEATRQMATVAAIPPAILLRMFGPEGGAVGTIVSALSLFLFRTPLVPIFAKYLGRSIDRFLVDTPFFVEAESGVGEGGKGA